MRYLPHTLETRKAMLEDIGVSSIEDLFEQVGAVDEASRTGLRLDLPNHLAEKS